MTAFQSFAEGFKTRNAKTSLLTGSGLYLLLGCSRGAFLEDRHLPLLAKLVS